MIHHLICNLMVDFRLWWKICNLMVDLTKYWSFILVTWTQYVHKHDKKWLAVKSYLRLHASTKILNFNTSLFFAPRYNDWHLIMMLYAGCRGHELEMLVPIFSFFVFTTLLFWKALAGVELVWVRGFWKLILCGFCMYILNSLHV